MKSLFFAFALIITVSAQAQVRPEHRTWACSGKQTGFYQDMYLGPAWGENAIGWTTYYAPMLDSGSWLILNKTVSNGLVIYDLRHNRRYDGGHRFKFYIEVSSGKAWVEGSVSLIKSFKCKSSSSVSDSLEVFDLLKNSGLTYLQCPEDDGRCKIIN